MPPTTRGSGHHCARRTGSRGGASDGGVIRANPDAIAGGDGRIALAKSTAP
jgi:hypothetical protein